MSKKTDKNSRVNSWRRKTAGSILLFFVLTSLVFSAPRPAEAIEIPVFDIQLLGKNIAKSIWDALKFVAEKAERQYDRITKETASVAFRKGVEFFVNKIAQDTAVWIASGAKGQGPLYFSQGWGEYLKDVADGAAGTILDDLSRATTYEQRAGSCECQASDGSGFSKNAANEAECTGLESTPDAQCTWTPPAKAVKEQGGMLEGFNICAPDIDVQLRIGLGLTPTGLGRPKCRFSTLKRNWEREITKASFLPDFQRTFNPEESDLGAALSLHTNLLSQQEQARQEAGMARLESQGFKPVTDFVSGWIKVPGQVVKEKLGEASDTANKSLLQDTGTILGNAIGVFTNTLASSFLNNLIKNGLGGGDSGSFGRRARGTATLTNPEAQVRVEGVSAARIRLAQDVTPNFSTPGRYDVLSLLVNCANPSKHGPNDCAITDNMRNAISQKMTVKQAVERGLFNSTGPFGFTSWEPQPIEPSLADGIPYRSILLMRKYRIVPVGWELAAKYIQYFDKKHHSLKELIDLYDKEPTDENPNPFYHFIDPDWVLSAPDAFCKLQGPGPEIISSQVGQGSDINKDGKYDGPDEEPPSVQVTRNENYCADEQTCIQKDSKGVCKFYGYCTEEKRVWNFGENSCQPEFNTCATLANKTTGETVSYLLNTVTFDSCDEKSVGCKQYSRNQASGVWSAAAAPYPDSIHLNAKAGTCDQTNAGCRAYIRTGLGLPAGDVVGVNLLQNGSFEEQDSADTTQALGWSGPPTISGRLQVDDAHDGQRFYHFIDNANVSQVLVTSLNKDGSYTLSFWARGSSGGVPNVYYNGVNPQTQLSLTSSLELTTEWQRYIVAIQPSQLNSTLQTLIINMRPNSDLDAVKLEAGATATPFSNYGSGANATAHLKRAPDYLSCKTSVKASDTPDPNADKQECQPYARFCAAEEAGCLRYAPTLGGAPITSVRGDVCPNECVGYDTYTQSKTFFESARFQDLIPKTAKKCSAAVAGCDEFTNLDVEKQGGEAKEYYQQLRFCQKSQTPPAVDEGVFYTWEGSDTTGFQLKVFNLKESNQGAPNPAPCTQLNWTSSDTAVCVDDTIVNGISRPAAACDAADLGSNPDCRQFYDANGNISYRLLSRTISISKDCRPYRKTSSTQSDCAMSSGYWNSAASACLYQAIPKEGRRCSAAAAGCREYRGGTAANYRTIFNDTFETGTGGWQNGVLSSVASQVGGHSYQFVISTSKQITLGGGSGNISQAYYQLGFWARTKTSTADLIAEIDTYIPNPNPPPAGAHNYISLITPEDPAALTTDWQFFQSDPIAINLTGAETDIKLLFRRLGTDNDIYIDNIELKSNVNTYYLIKNSWNTPGSCLAPEQMLGCQAFKVSDGKTRNIWRFGPSCHDKVVGCEAVVDTQNTTKGDNAPFVQTFEGKVTVPADEVDYIVNDPAKQCRAEFQGCEALGTPTAPTTTQASYLINNPDKYTDILCRSEQVNCAAYTTSKNTEIYFKDPGNNVCRYVANRQYPGWYRDVCSNDSTQSCTTAADCKDDSGNPVPRASCGPPPSNSQPNCQKPSTDMPHTLASSVKEPLDGQVGLCPAEQNSCTEFIDPRSDSERNLIYNGSFLDLDGNREPDGWENVDGSPFLGYNSSAEGILVSQKDGNGLWQEVNFEASQLYILSAEVEAGEDATVPAMIGLRDCRSIQPSLEGLQSSMVDATYRLPTGGNGVAAIITPEAGKFTRFSGQFYMKASATCDIVLGTADMLSEPLFTGNSGSHIFKNISLRKAVIDYQLADRVDRKTCAGVVDNNTCVLFNERAVDSARSVQEGGTTIAYKNLTSDADTSPTDEKIPSAPSDNTTFDSNAIIKVSPDRECASWLSCRTARTVTANGVTKNICLAVQNCEELDPNTGFCLKQVLSDAPDSDLTFEKGNVDLLQNRSGYSRVGFDWGADSDGNPRIIQGYMSPAFMPQIDGELTVYNGNFEIATSAGKPGGWEGWRNGENFRVIDNPLASQKAGVTYPMEERRFLEVSANNTAPADDKTYVSYDIPATPDTAYVISAYLNTLHFTGKRVEVRVYEYDDQGRAFDPANPLRPGPRIPLPGGSNGSYSATLNLGPGFDWSLMVDKFKTHQDSDGIGPDTNTAFIRLQFAWDATSDSSGLWYIDDLKIQPALQYQKNEYYPSYTTPDFSAKPYERGLETLDYHYAPQSCRLYPEPDALSCRYYDDKGLRQRGKLGYCLEWDPQNSNYCLQWWPVDSVTGEDTGEDRAGYNDRAPLYYCLNSADGFIAMSRVGEEQPFEWWRIKDGQQLAVEGGNWEYGNLANGQEIVIDIISNGSSFTGGYSVYGVIDKPGDCSAMSGGNGCEIVISDEVNEDTGDKYEVYLSKDGTDRYFLNRWCEKVTCDNNDAPIGSPRYHTGDKVMWLDVAWAKDENGKTIPGPFRYVVIRATGDFNNYQADSSIGNPIQIRPNYSCKSFIQTVTPTGQNKVYASRMATGSTYLLPMGVATYRITTNPMPFGAALPPEPVDEPGEWDGLGLDGTQPLFPIPSSSTIDQEQTQTTAGAPYSCTRVGDGGANTLLTQCSSYTGDVAVTTPADAITQKLSQLFVESYGTWEWAGNVYQSKFLDKLTSPTRWCVNNNRDTDPGLGACGVAPQVPEIRINNSTSSVELSRIGTVTLSFTTVADPDQLPITRYIVDWGDGTTSTQAGLRLQSRPSMQNAITLVHTYTYSDIVRNPSSDCSDGSCTVTPRVQITDNWGWCNGPYDDPTAVPRTPVLGCAIPSGDQLACRTGYFGADCQIKPDAWRVSTSTITVKE